MGVVSEYRPHMKMGCLGTDCLITGCSNTGCSNTDCLTTGCSNTGCSITDWLNIDCQCMGESTWYKIWLQSSRPIAGSSSCMIYQCSLITTYRNSTFCTVWGSSVWIKHGNGFDCAGRVALPSTRKIVEKVEQNG